MAAPAIGPRHASVADTLSGWGGRWPGRSQRVETLESVDSGQNEKLTKN